MLTRTPGPVRTALSLFTAVPVRGPAELTRATAARAVRWLPAVGALLGAAAGGALWLVDSAVSGPLAPLLSATIAVAVLAGLTGGLHLDGLADTADGLASRRPAPQALEIMRRSDLGPLGAAALILVILLQMTAIATLPRGLPAACAVLIAAITARTAVVLAAGGPVPPARPDGFGALVAGTVSARARALVAVPVIAVVAALSLGMGGIGAVGAGLAMVAVGLLAGYAMRRMAQRRLGGMTGDVFGAIVELSTAAALLSAAILL